MDCVNVVKEERILVVVVTEISFPGIDVDRDNISHGEVCIFSVKGVIREELFVGLFDTSVVAVVVKSITPVETEVISFVAFVDVVVVGDAA